MKVTEHFTWQEVSFSETAARNGIDNIPPLSLHDNIKDQAELMEQVRDLLGHPVFISSWYRCPEVNKLIGGADKSAHMLGLACDFVCPGFGTPYQVCKELEKHMEWLGIDQLIHEFGAWVHIGKTEGTPKNQLLTAKKVDGKTVYVTGIEKV